MENPIKPNTKIRILSPEHSEYVQKLAFKAGFRWISREPTSIQFKDSRFMFFQEDMIIAKSSSADVFDGCNEKEIFIDMPSKRELLNHRFAAYAEQIASLSTDATGKKYDQGKPAYNLIPVHAEAEFVDVLTFGANKYGPNNWRNVEPLVERYTAATMRHLASYRMGETHDPESGKHHLAHAMCCLAFIIESDLEKDK